MTELREGMKPIPFALAAFGLALSLSGCAQQMLYATTNGHGGHEYFPQGKYGTASARVVTSGPVPKGGGQYLVGRPYHVNGRTYVPTENDNYAATGIASWYGDAFHGRRTANGEVYDMAAITAAHPTMPLPSYARITNTGNGRSIIVRVNDRGPYAPGRVMDVSSRVADLLDMKGAGTAHVHIEYVGKAPIDGSDDTQLAGTLRTDGSLAQLDGSSGGTMLASLMPQPAAPEPAPPPPPAPEPKVALYTPPPPPPAAAAVAQASSDDVSQDVAPATNLVAIKSPLPPNGRSI